MAYHEWLSLVSREDECVLRLETQNDDDGALVVGVLEVQLRLTVARCGDIALRVHPIPNRDADTRNEAINKAMKQLMQSPHELEGAVRRNKRNYFVPFEAIVADTRMEGTVVDYARINEGQQQVRHAAQATVG